MPHHITHEHVQAWLDALRARLADLRPGEVEALFTEDAEYRWHPADDPEAGRDAIVFAWLNPGGNASDRDAPGTYWRVPPVRRWQPCRRGRTSTYWTDASRSTIARVYCNNWLLEFGDDGRCCSFTEYWMLPRTERPRLPAGLRAPTTGQCCRSTSPRDVDAPDRTRQALSAN